jgi:hypothetical protein
MQTLQSTPSLIESLCATPSFWQAFPTCGVASKLPAERAGGVDIKGTSYWLLIKTCWVEHQSSRNCYPDLSSAFQAAVLVYTIFLRSDHLNIFQHSKLAISEVSVYNLIGSDWTLNSLCVWCSKWWRVPRYCWQISQTDRRSLHKQPLMCEFKHKTWVFHKIGEPKLYDL